MATLAWWLNHIGERVESIVFYPHRWHDDGDVWWSDVPLNEVIPFTDVPASVLNHEFDHGFGGNEGPEFHAWTENFVAFPDDYDGAEHICVVPRNPEVVEGYGRPGGG